LLGWVVTNITAASLSGWDSLVDAALLSVGVVGVGATAAECVSGRALDSVGVTAKLGVGIIASRTAALLGEGDNVGRGCGLTALAVRCEESSGTAALIVGGELAGGWVGESGATAHLGSGEEGSVATAIQISAG